MNDNNNQIVPDSKIREIFLRNGFTIKDGHDDLNAQQTPSFRSGKNSA